MRSDSRLVAQQWPGYCAPTVEVRVLQWRAVFAVVRQARGHRCAAHHRQFLAEPFGYHLLQNWVLGDLRMQPVAVRPSSAAWAAALWPWFCIDSLDMAIRGDALWWAAGRLFIPSSAEAAPSPASGPQPAEWAGRAADRLATPG